MDWEALKLRDPKLYQIAHDRGTENAFSGKYVHTNDQGVYHCAICNAPLFASNAKFNHGNGWPAFSHPIREKAVVLKREREYGTENIEVECAGCHAYIGRLFCRETQGGGKICDRFCINSISLTFKAE